MPIPDLNEAVKRQDARLRRKLLYVLFVTSRTAPNGHLSGRKLADGADGLMPRGQGFRDDQHALSLMRDLVNLGLATERPLGYRRRGEQFGVDYVEFAITAEGSDLHMEQRAPVAMVDDDRVSE